MSEMRLIPCSRWMKKLAALHPDDLTPTEWEQLNSHVTRCARCAAVLHDYEAMDILIRASLIKRPMQPSNTMASWDKQTVPMSPLSGGQNSPETYSPTEWEKAPGTSLSAIPEDLRDQLQKGIVEFLVRHSGELGEQAAEALRQLSSQPVFRSTFDDAVARAVQRFIAEYTVTAAHLVASIVGDKHFWESEDVRQRLKLLVARPDYWQVNERASTVQHFADVLPEEGDREGLDKAATFFLRCLVEELWKLPGAEEIGAIYNLQFQKRGYEAAKHRAASLRAQLQANTELSSEVRQALLQLAVALERRFLVGPYHNLPRPDYTHFVGRERELDWLHQSLTAKEDNTQVAITGMGGVGKSALVLALAHRYVERYKDLQPDERFEAILWISANEKLSDIEEAGVAMLNSGFFPTLEDMYTIIARTLGRKDITRATDREKRDSLVRKALDSQRTLLILDNLESFTDERINPFLSSLPPSTKCLITSRKESRIFRSKQLRGLPSGEAERIVIEEVGIPRMELNSNQLRVLFGYTGRLPLPIKLSAARIASGEAFERVVLWLENARENVPEYCVKGQIELIRQLSSGAWSLLLACSLFDQTAGASREALGFIANLSAAERDIGLALLLSFHLLNRNEDDRFWLLPIVRRFAEVERSRADCRTLTERWLHWLLDFAQNRGVDLEFHVEDTHVVGLEYPNLLHAIRWCRTHQRVAELLSLAEGACFYPYLLDLFSELKEVLDAGLETSRVLGLERNEGRFLRQIGRLLWKQGQYEAALDYLDKSGDVARRHGDIVELGRADNIRFDIVYRQGRMQEAEQIAQAMWDNGNQSASLELKILAVYRLAQCALKRGQFDKALEWLDQSEVWCRKLCWSRRLAWNMHLRGVTLSQQGNIPAAEPFLLESLHMAVSWKEHYLVALNKHSLTEVYAEADRLHLALQMVEEAHNLYERLGATEELEQVEALLQTFPRTIA
ncbi:MAG TPA: NB-ARC domain-containing protein [Ktedonobacteraceae bacterium]|nr:NB-ARC domain-containing protein [Ktedonobacteraceae bacterium]